MVTKPAEFSQLFAVNYIYFKAQATIAELVAQHLAEFTPEGLNLAIQEGWSLVNTILALPPPDRKEYLEYILEEISSSGLQPSEEFIGSISPSELVDNIDNLLPEHAAVLQRNLDWISREISRVRYLMNLTKA